MGIRELSELYGSTNGSQLINDAIRAEIVGGNEVLDALGIISQVIAACSENKKAKAEKLFTLLREAKSKMADSIAKKYDLKSTREDRCD